MKKLVFVLVLSGCGGPGIQVLRSGDAYVCQYSPSWFQVMTNARICTDQKECNDFCASLLEKMKP